MIIILWGEPITKILPLGISRKDINEANTALVRGVELTINNPSNDFHPYQQSKAVEAIGTNLGVFNKVQDLYQGIKDNPFAMINHMVRSFPSGEKKKLFLEANSFRLKPRNSGLRKVTDVFLEGVRLAYPLLYDYLAPKVLTLQELNPECKTLFPISVHHSEENLQQVLQSIADQNLNRKEYCIVLYINGELSETANQAIRDRVKDVQTFLGQEKYKDVNIRVLTGQLPEKKDWHYGLKFMPFLASVMLANQLAYKHNIDHDLNIYGLDADLLGFIHKNYISDVLKTLKTRVVVAGYPSDYPKEFKKYDVNLYARHLVRNTVEDYIDSLGGDSKIIPSGANYASSLIAYCLSGGHDPSLWLGEDVKLGERFLEAFPPYSWPAENMFGMLEKPIYTDPGASLRTHKLGGPLIMRSLSHKKEDLYMTMKEAGIKKIDSNKVEDKEKLNLKLLKKQIEQELQYATYFFSGHYESMDSFSTKYIERLQNHVQYHMENIQKLLKNRYGISFDYTLQGRPTALGLMYTLKLDDLTLDQKALEKEFNQL